jgi:hypothetical protein
MIAMSIELKQLLPMWYFMYQKMKLNSYFSYTTNSMSESLFDILSRRDDSEPAEISSIKRFVKERYNTTVKVSLRKNQIIIYAKNAALAGTLRMHILELQKIIKTKSRIIIRIG